MTTQGPPGTFLHYRLLWVQRMMPNISVSLCLSLFCPSLSLCLSHSPSICLALALTLALALCLPHFCSLCLSVCLPLLPVSRSVYLSSPSLCLSLILVSASQPASDSWRCYIR